MLDNVNYNNMVLNEEVQRDHWPLDESDVDDAFSLGSYTVEYMEDHNKLDWSERKAGAYYDHLSEYPVPLAKHPVPLSKLNDSGFTFEEIADVIEELL